MRSARMFAILGMVALSVYICSATGVYARFEEGVMEKIDEGRMKNVIYSAPENTSPIIMPEKQELSMPIETAPASDDTVQESEAQAVQTMGDVILETTIEGGLAIKNETSYQVNIGQILMDSPPLTLGTDGPQVLIIHTHSSEAYTQAGLDRYEPSDTNRTENTDYNIVRIGDELENIFTAAGLEVIHDRGIYDYPSYTGSYTRSGAAIEEYLREYPSIAVVIDMHRDALGSNGVVYKTMAEEDGVCASQVMMLVGTDESGLDHPQWRTNLSLALYLQNAVSNVHPTLMRPVSLVRQRYNQHLCTGSLILEVGSSGNTLQEALAAIRLFGDAAGPALKKLVQAELESAS